jgi:hypothetical protein
MACLGCVHLGQVIRGKAGHAAGHRAEARMVELELCERPP